MILPVSQPLANIQRRLRVGVLGTSYWAWWCHGTVLAAHPDIDFVGFWGRTRQNADAAINTVGAGEAFDDLDAFLGRVDLVSVALPPDVQARLAPIAASAGKHLLLDKPLALDLGSADRVVEAVDQSDVITLTFLTYMFQPDVIAWLQRMEQLADTAGPWEGAIVTCAGSIDLTESPYRQSEWRRQRGGLWDLGPHALSVVQALLPPIRQVSATRGIRDTINLCLEHEGGTGSVLTLTVTAPETAQEYSITVWGPAGRHHLDLPTGGLREAYFQAVDQLIGAVIAHERHRLDATHARAMVAVLDAAQHDVLRPKTVPTALPRRGKRPSGPAAQPGRPITTRSLT